MSYREKKKIYIISYVDRGPEDKAWFSSKDK